MNDTQPSATFLTRPELASRWRCRVRYLHALAWRREGPPYRIIANRALYDLVDIEAFERAQLVHPATNLERAA